MLAVQTSTTLGELNVRIELGRPDIDDSMRRTTAIEVAGRILPKFPGVEQPPPPEVDLAAERGDADRSSDDLVERLSAGEAAGEWTRGEGLIELLGPLVDLDLPDNTGDIDGFGRSGTGLVALARQHISDGDDPTTADELTALLDRAFPSSERIEAATPTTSTTTSTTTTTTLAVNAFRRSAEPPDECAERINGYCIVTINFDDLDQAYGTDKYLMFTPAGVASNDFGPWPDGAVGWIGDAIRASANRYESLGTMPDTSVLLAGDGNAPAMSDATPDLCSVGLRTSILDFPKAQVQQFVAGEMAHCFLAATFTNIHGGTYDPSTWWSGGLAIWLSTLVYPSANLEWIHLPSALSGHELHTSIFQRTATNWMWFQHLQWEYGEESLLGLVGNLPPSGQSSVVATWPNMDRISHEYAQSMSDLGVPDSGNNQMAGAYDPPAEQVEVDAPTSLLNNVDEFRVDRVELIVLNGDVACIDAEPIDGARLTWREGLVRQAGLWSASLPTTLTGEATFVASSLDDGAAFRITVNDVVEDEDDCEPEDDGNDDAEGNDCQIECGFSEFYSRPGG